MRLIALSTSGRAASAALIEDGVVTGFELDDHGLTHSETILPLVASLMEKRNIRPTDLDALACDIGPGSFTGVRIGVCVVNAMAMALQKPVIAVDALLALYTGVSAPGAMCAVIDARNGNCYAALYHQGRCLMEPSAIAVSDLLGLMGKETLFVGDGAVNYREEIALSLPTAAFAPPGANLLRADAVGRAAWKKLQNGETAGEAMPLYLRPTQAERLYPGRTDERDSI